MPGLYGKIYRYSAYRKASSKSRYLLYEKLFLTGMKRLLEEYKPDLAVCTHALPSYLLSHLQAKKEWKGTVINAYTDFFINDIWGVPGKGYHLVPNSESKDLLVSRGVDEEAIFVTGIPVHPLFQKENAVESSKKTVLISGGNMGAGAILNLLKSLAPNGDADYTVLCGKNRKLFEYIKQLSRPSIKPIGFIESKEEMNRLYDEAHAIITKPGGVTVSECLLKRLPIFVYDALPGQEEMNLDYLYRKGLVRQLNNWRTSNWEAQLLGSLNCSKTAGRYKEKVQDYVSQLDKRPVAEILGAILNI